MSQGWPLSRSGRETDVVNLTLIKPFKSPATEILWCRMSQSLLSVTHTDVLGFKQSSFVGHLCPVVDLVDVENVLAYMRYVDPPRFFWSDLSVDQNLRGTHHQ